MVSSSFNFFVEFFSLFAPLAKIFVMIEFELVWIMKTVIQLIFSWVQLTCYCNDLCFKCTEKQQVTAQCSPKMLLPEWILTKCDFFAQFKFFTFQFINSKFTWDCLIFIQVYFHSKKMVQKATFLSFAYFRNETCMSDISFSLAARSPLSASICFSGF